MIILLGIFAGNSWIFLNGFPHTHDGGYHIQFFIGIDQNLRSGNFLPYWISNPFGGSGQPVYFYNYFVDYTVEFIHLFENNIFKSMDLLVPITYVASGLSFFLLTKKIIRIPFISFIASVFYMYAPYRFTDSHSRGDFAESFTFIFIPLIVYFTLQACQNSTTKYVFRYVLLGGVSFAALLLTHSLIMYLFFFFIFIPLAIYKVIQKHSLMEIRNFISVFFIGVGLTAYYWLPIILEKKFITTESFLRVKLDNFAVPFGATLFGDIWSEKGFHLFLGYPALAAMLIGVIIFYKKKPILLLVLYSVFILFLMTKDGLPLLESLPGSNFLQFQFRLLTIVTFITSILLALVIKESYNRLQGRLQTSTAKTVFIYGLTCSVVISIFIMSYPLTKTMYWIVESPTVEQICCFSSPDITYLPSTVPLNYSEELKKQFPFTIKDMGDPTSRQQLLNSWKSIPLYSVTSLDTKENNSNNETQIDIKNSPTLWLVKTKSDNENKVTFRIFYYPGWNIYLDDKKLPNSYDNSTGYITALVPSGEHHLKIIFEDTSVRLIGKATTLIIIFVIIAIFLIKRFKKNLITKLHQ